MLALSNIKKIPEICAKEMKHMEKKSVRRRRRERECMNFLSLFLYLLVHLSLRSIGPFFHFMVITFVLFGCNSYFYALFVSFKAQKKTFFPNSPQTQCNNLLCLLVFFSCFLYDLINALSNIRRNSQTLNSVCMCL